MPANLTRRYFLQVLAATAATSAGAIEACSSSSGGGDPEPFGDVTAGNVSAIQVGTVQTVPGAPAFIGRDSNGLYAMTSTCTHAGCDMQTAAKLTTTITCGCHQSQFDLNGDVLQGPATKPLAHFAVAVGADGTITVHGGSQVGSDVRTAIA